jgi:small subunit ribosomal protein S11
MARKRATGKVKTKEKRSIVHGVVHICCTFNNCIVSVSDHDGNILCWQSAGGSGFKGSRKGTPFAAQTAAEQAARKAGDYGIRKVDIVIKGPGSGRETAIRSVGASGLEVTSIRDETPIPHNGCRPPKRRRV